MAASLTDTDDDADSIHDEYQTTTPFLKRVQYADGNERLYLPIQVGERTRFGPNFMLPDAVDPSASALCELYLPDTLIDKWVKRSNSYAKSYLARERQVELTRSDLLRFIATLYYMGVVRLPCKDDYWKGGDSDGAWPTHPAIKLKITRFRYIWRNFHMSYQELDVHSETTSDDESDGSVSTTEDLEDVADLDQQAVDQVPQPPWYSKEGYKFYALCCSQSGFIFNFFPDGRMETNTTIDCVSKLIESIPQRQQKEFVIAMDNYFTTPRVKDFPANHRKSKV